MGQRLNQYHDLPQPNEHYTPKWVFDALGLTFDLDVAAPYQNKGSHVPALSYLTKEIPKLLISNNIKPDLILFLGDSNSAGVAFPLKKEGYKIGHIEAGMRSYDKRMLEEINRTVCDHCSDILFVYHDDYKAQLSKENITKNVFVVGNTIVEPFKMFSEQIMVQPKRKDMILDSDCHYQLLDIKWIEGK
jgi:UDP-N-acetylglucosamine 2-epimerase